MVMRESTEPAPGRPDQRRARPGWCARRHPGGISASSPMEPRAGGGVAYIRKKTGPGPHRRAWSSYTLGRAGLERNLHPEFDDPPVVATSVRLIGGRRPTAGNLQMQTKCKRDPGRCTHRDLPRTAPFRAVHGELSLSSISSKGDA